MDYQLPEGCVLIVTVSLADGGLRAELTFNEEYGQRVGARDRAQVLQAAMAAITAGAGRIVPDDREVPAQWPPPIVVK